MAQVGFNGIEAAIQKLKKHQLLVKGNIANAKRKLVYAVWVDLIKNTPQWSGNLVSNWFIEVSGRRSGYLELPSYWPGRMFSAKDWVDAYGEPLKRGDDVGYMLSYGKELSETIKWNSNVVIKNYADYASEVESNLGPTLPKPSLIRSVNYHPTYGKVAMVAYVTTKYNVLRNTKRFAK